MKGEGVRGEREEGGGGESEWWVVRLTVMLDYSIMYIEGSVF